MKKQLVYLSLVLLVSILLSYMVVSNKDVKSSELEFKYIDETLSDCNISDGWSSVKTFSVKNNSSSTKKYNIVIKNFINTFKGSGLEYKVTSTNNGYNMSSFKSLAKSETLTDEVISYNTSIDSGVTQTYTVTFRYTNGVEDDIGSKLSGMFSISEGTSQSLYSKLLEDKFDVKTRTDFSTPLTTDNTNTLYTSTENGTTVYYFAGNPTDNWVKFGKYEKDFVAYKGYYSSTSTNFKDYQTLEACTSASSYNVNCTLYKYASAGDDIYWRIIRTNADGGIRLLYHSTSPTAEDAYIGTSAVNSSNDDSMYVGYMYGTSGSLENNRANTNDSAIKTAVDIWYEKNLKTNHGKYLSTTAVYCNDRTSKNTYFDDINFGPYTRLDTKKEPTYDCANDSDSFSVSNSSAKLTNPIGLMTADEISFAGGVSGSNALTYYYRNSSSTSKSSTGTTWWWTMSPYYWNGSYSFIFFVQNSINLGYLNSATVDCTFAVRPVISLKSCVKWSGGDGSATNPYTIVESESGC